MILTDKVEKSRLGQIVAIIFFLLGFPLLFALYAGTIIGATLILAALWARSPKKIWKCAECGHLFARA